MKAIQLDTKQASIYSKNIANIATTCETVFSNIINIVNELNQDKNTWDGKVASDFSKQFENLKPSFNVALGIFDKTANDISNVINNVEKTDSV